jgi:hypothetical protein
MHQQLWGYKVEWKSVSRGTGGKRVEYHCSRSLLIILVRSDDSLALTDLMVLFQL